MTIRKPFYTVPYNTEITGVYHVTGASIDSKIRIVGHERYSALTQMLYQPDTGKILKVGALLVKNTAIKKLSKGETVMAVTTKGDKVKIKRIGNV